MTDEFDDDALRRAIGTRAGGSVDVGSARQAVIDRANRTRTVRAVAIGGTAGLVLLAGLLFVPRSSDDTIVPADRPTVPTPSIEPEPSMTVDPTDEFDDGTMDEDASPAEVVTTTDDDIDDTADDDRSDDSTPPTTATGVPADNASDDGGAIVPQPSATATTITTNTTVVAVPPPAATPTTTTAPMNTTGPSITTVTTATTAPSTTAAPTTTEAPTTPPFTKQYSSFGGTITVSWNGSALSLLSVDPSAGYEADVEDQSATRIRVRFRADDDVRIEVRVSDGVVEESIG